MEILIILLLIVLNGAFAMAEIAIVSARKSKLQEQANKGDKQAQAALELSQNPNRFLSTVQVGITLIGIFAGAFGGTTIAKNVSVSLSSIPLLDPYSEALSLGLVVISITYLSLILGELVPKRIALNGPEKIAALVARPMNALSQLTAPFVSLLTVSTDWVVRLLGIKAREETQVSEEEVKLLIREGARTGIFTGAEKDIVERTLRLSDKKINSLMTPRKEIVWIDMNTPLKTIRNKIIKDPHSHFPVCRDSLDKVIGVIRTKDVLTNFLSEEKLDLEKSLLKPLFIPESIDGLKVLELFKKSGIHLAFVIDEYGNLQGLLSLTDILEAIVGDIPTINEFEEKEIVKRENGTWLVDGLVPIDEFKEYFRLKKLPGEIQGTFHTIGGFIVSKLNRIPNISDTVDLGDLRFEVMDMDGNRVDKILVTPLKKTLKG